MMRDGWVCSDLCMSNYRNDGQIALGLCCLVGWSVGWLVLVLGFFFWYIGWMG